MKRLKTKFIFWLLSFDTKTISCGFDGRSADTYTYIIIIMSVCLGSSDADTYIIIIMFVCLGSSDA